MSTARYDWDTFSPSIQQSASALDDARRNNYQIEPLSKSMFDLDQTKGYEIAAAIRALRESKHGEVVAGRKIGFTNHNIWPEYNIDASNWSYMYQNSIVDLTQSANDSTSNIAEVDLTHMSRIEPRIEPEIVLGISKPIAASMSDVELLGCIEWIAHGFEIVASIFPDWKFTAADTTAAFALHNQLLVGEKISVEKLSDGSVAELAKRLSTFTVKLFQNGEKVDEGSGSNVLGSPIKALRHLAELLEKDELNSPLTAGEVVTTGTLTRALPIHHNDTWSTKLSGIGLKDLDIKFKLR